AASARRHSESLQRAWPTANGGYGINLPGERGSSILGRFMQQSLKTARRSNPMASFNHNIIKHKIGLERLTEFLDKP
ncbi:hypothetical protein, partial [Paludibacterium paludis]|uniref:hypothetical protein n=1 Tax=Paludibacterium paludis TaxID=1225769 RepID=UPI001E2EE48F